MTDAPCTVASCVRMKFLRAVIELPLRQRLAPHAELEDRDARGVVLEISGGVVPAGLVRRSCCETAVTSAIAEPIWVFE